MVPAGSTNTVLPFSITVRAPAGANQPAQIIPGGLSNSGIIITQASVSESGNFQMQHTFGKTVYTYVFGDRVGELKLAGMCFDDLCGAAGVRGSRNVLSSYETNRIAARQAPLYITYGSVVFVGFLTGLALDVVDPNTQLGQWSFRFNTFRARG
jgi:hypothetical protein